MADLIKVPEPDFSVKYGHQEETVFLDPYVTRIAVTDNLTGQADEAEMTLENRDGLFLSGYFPLRGDDFDVAVGWKNGEIAGLYGMGNFIIDEAQVQGPPDQIMIRGLSSSVKSPARSPRSRAFENVTLKQIVQKVADGLGYLTEMANLPDLTFNRISQYRETDLAFLDRIAREFGCIMKMKVNTVVLSPLRPLLSIDSGLGIGRNDVIRYSLRSKTAETHRATVSRYWDPGKKDQTMFLGPTKFQAPKTNTHPAPAPGAGDAASRTFLGPSATMAVDVAKVFARVENAAQAQARMDASQLFAAMGNVAGNIEVMGDPRIRAGGTVYLFPEDWGAMGGWYVVNRVKHSLDRSGGFTSDVDLCHNPHPPASHPTKTKPGAPPKKLGK